MGSKFKVGDRVVWEDKEYASNYDSTTLNSIMVVESVAYDSLEESYLVQMDNGTRAYDFRFKLYKEDPMKQEFDMKTQPWFIRVNNEQEFHIVQEWLKENFGTVPYFGWYPQTKGLTNTDVEGKLYSDYVMWFCDEKNLNQNTNEIKLRFKTTIDSVEWPIVESEKDRKIRELKETIETATKQIKELENM